VEICTAILEGTRTKTKSVQGTRVWWQWKFNFWRSTWHQYLWRKLRRNFIKHRVQVKLIYMKDDSI